MNNKLKNFSEGKIKIHEGEPVIAFKLSGKEPFWKVKKENNKKLVKIKELKTKLWPLMKEFELLDEEIKKGKSEFWKGVFDLFDEESKKQLFKFDQEVSEKDLEIYCVKPNVEEMNEKTNALIKRAEEGEFGNIGKFAGQLILNKNWTKAETRSFIREKIKAMLPEEILPKLEIITDKMVNDIYDKNGERKSFGAISINEDGETKVVNL